MDTWKYYAITHADHVVCNPLGADRLDEIVGLFDLPPGARAWEAACGKGELLVRLAERYGAGGVGVDISPYELRVARDRAAQRVPAADLRFLEGDAATLRAEPSSVDLAAAGLAADSFATHHGNVAIGAEEGLVLLWTMASGEADWDRYEMLQLRAAERYARTMPNDPDVPELLGRVRADVESYLRWGRDTLGWAVYLFLVPA
jgi:SAM-dependent methyltransferase